ncbi:hypothetical protein H3V53_03370 [Paraburkholderia bengalensis]|uniref:Uncharacterized protein n=1 Tax=Paraburkholderia bengalensis TaxID=2747562 RepID=A0ABU8ILE4_9BURK
MSANHALNQQAPSAEPNPVSDISGSANKAERPGAAVQSPFSAVIHRISATPQRLHPAVVARRNQLLHPLIAQTEPILTPPVSRIFSAVEQSALSGLSGSYICGNHNDGVSMAINYCERTLPTRIPGIVTFRHNFGASTDSGDRDSISAFANSCGVGVVHGRTADIRTRLLRHIVVRTRTSELRTAIFFLDNVHYMHDWDIAVLYDIRHELVANHLSVNFVAGTFYSDLPALDERLKREAASRSRRSAVAQHPSLESSIIERDLGFTSIGTRDELGTLFKAIDTLRDRSQKSWTAHFLPQAVKKGYLFENEAETLFRMLDKYDGWAKAGFSAKALFACIRRFLTKAKAFDDSRSAPAGLDEKLWVEALEASCFVDRMDEKMSDGVHNGYTGPEA